MKSWKKRALALTMAALVVLSGCTFPFGQGNDGDGAPVDNVDVSDAYFGLAWYRSGTTLNPVMDGTEVNSMLREALYEGLFEIKSDFTLENELCEDYTSDGTAFSFTIKKGIKFWSGAELTASDVAESLKTVLENESSPYHNRLTEVASIEAVTKRMVRITLASPNVNFPKLLDIPIYRAGTTDEGEFAEGTGPYKPVQNGAAWTLEANENWHGGFLGTIRHITLVKMTRADAADTSFRTGDVSIMRSARIAPDDQNIAFTGEVDTVPVSSAMLHYIGLNYNNSQFTNAKVRQALSMAISRQGLCATQLQDYADPAVLPINPQPADTGVSYSLSADLMTAAQLLREAAQEGAASAGGSDGNTDSSDGDSDSTDNSDDDSDTSSDSSEEDGYYDEDGDFIYYTSGRASDTDYKVDFLTVRTPKNRTDSTVSDGKVVFLDNENTDSGDSTDSTDGSGSTDTAVTDTIVTDAATVQLSFRLLVNSDNAFKVAAAKQVAASWNSLNGVNVTVDEEPYDTYVSMLQSGSFDAYYGETQLTPDFDLRPLLSPQGGLNYGSYSSEDMSNAITAYRSGENTEGLYTTFLNEMPLIPLAFERQQVVLRSGLINHFNPAPYNAFAGQENWVKP